MNWKDNVNNPWNITSVYVPAYKILAMHPTGSKFICDPPPLGSDNDTLVLVDHLEPAREDYTKNGWSETEGANGYEGEPGYGDLWVSFKKGFLVVENHILVSDKRLYLDWIGATLMAKEMNLQDKEERVHLHKYMKQLGFVDYYKGPLPGVKNIE